jgi:hypothetical protein
VLAPGLMLSDERQPLRAFAQPASTLRYDVAFLCGTALALQLLSACTQPVYQAPSPDAATAPRCELDCGAGVPRTTPQTEPPGDGSRAQVPERDSGSPKDSTPDAAEPYLDDGAAPSSLGSAGSAARLVGDYAILARYFGWDTTGLGGSFSEEIVSLASIRSAADGKLTMTTHTCDHRGSADALVVAPIISRVVSPQALPPHHFDLEVTGDTFRTTGPAVPAGYEEVSAADCPAGTKKNYPERRWLPGGECTCPTSKLPPTQIDDCRVVDSDDDQEAGLTVEYKGGTENITRTRLRDSSQIVNGVIDAAGKHRAAFAADMGTYHLKCELSSCTQRAARVCAPEFNPVRFLPLATRADARAWTCEDVEREIDDTGQFGLPVTTPPEC